MAPHPICLHDWLGLYTIFNSLSSFEMIIQNIIVICVVLAASFFLIKKGYDTFTANQDCGGDCGCSAQELKKNLKVKS